MLKGVVGVAVGSALLVVGTSGSADAAWSSARDVSADGWLATDWPQVSVDRQGDALLVWTACDGSQSSCYHQVQARLKPKGEPMGRIKNLSPLGPSSVWPMVDSDDDGDAAVVWEQDSTAVGRRISASGVVGPLRALSTTSATAVNVAVAPGGRALAVWTEYGTGGWVMRARFFYKDGSLGRVLDLGSGSGDTPGVAIDRNGLAVVAWTEGNQNVVARRIRPGYMSDRRVFTTPIADLGGFGVPRVSVDRDGDATLFFRSGGGAHPRFWARRWNHSGSLSKIVAISPRTQNAGNYYTVASDLQGDSMFVWTRWNSDGRTELFGRRLSRTGSLGTSTRLGYYDRPDLVLDDDGDGLVVSHFPSSPYDATKVSARRVSRSGTFGASKTLTSDGRVPQVDSSPTGRFTVVWQQETMPYQIHVTTGP